jgi:Tol biopolymer transport system component
VAHRLATRQVIRAVSVAVAVGLFLLPAAPAQAAFPGANGKIAFSRSGDIYTINPDGSGESNLTNSAATDLNPRWRPDGQKIAFQSNGTAMLMNPDGTGVQQLAPSNPQAYVGSWSPDGQRIAYAVDTTPEDPVPGIPDTEIAVANADGTNQTLLTGDSATLDAAPAWSPDGQKIATRNATCSSTTSASVTSMAGATCSS